MTRKNTEGQPTSQSPIENLPIEKICAECQQDALDAITRQALGLGATLCYCQHTRRALFLRAWNGEIEVAQLSKPSDREHIEAQFFEYWTAWLQTAETSQAEIELAEHARPLH